VCLAYDNLDVKNPCAVCSTDGYRVSILAIPPAIWSVFTGAEGQLL